MRIRNGIATTLHAYSADSEFTNVLKGRYITNDGYVGDELIPREFVIDMFASDGYAKHIILSNGVPGKTVNYTTGDINQ